MLRKSLLSLKALFLTFYIFGQCEFPVPPGDICQEATYICHDFLDGYCSSTAFGNFTLPGPFCGTVETDKWFKFLAGSPSLTIEVVPSNCQGTPTGMGIQAQIYQTPDCVNFIPESDCFSPGFASPGLLFANNLTVGATYYLLIDGWAGDICDFEINILSGTTSVPLGIPGPVFGPTEVCQGSFATYSTLPIPGATSYQWSINPPIGTIIGIQSETIINVFWANSPSEAEVCVEAFNECDGTTTNSCTTVFSNPPPPAVVVIKELCLADVIICDGNDFSAPGTYSVVLNNASWLGCDSIYYVEVIPIIIPPTFLSETICIGECLDIWGMEFCHSTIFTHTLTSYQGCDSIVILDLEMLPFSAEITPPNNLSCQDSTVVLDASSSIIPPGGSLEWTGPGTSGLDTLVIEVDTAATYCFIIMDSLNNSCSHCVEVGGVSSPPSIPQIVGPDTILFGTENVFAAEFQAYVTNYEWTSSVGIFTESNDGSSILFDIQANSSAEICLSMENGCGWSDEYCHTVFANPNVPNDLAIIGAENPCIFSNEFYYIEADTNIALITWSLFGGSPVLFGQGNDTISIEWLNTDPVAICVAISYIDSTFGQTCLEIFPTDLPSPVSLGSSIVTCVGELFEICASPGDYTNLEWTLPTSADFMATSFDCIEVQWNEAGNYQMCVAPENDCGAGVQTCIDVFVEPVPTANISGAGSICQNSGNSVDLNIELTGNSPWSVDYSIDGVPQTSLLTSNSPYTLISSTPGTYTIDIIIDGLGCVGIGSGSAEIIELDAPQVSGITITADIDNQTYTVSFGIAGGDPASYSISGLSGTLSAVSPYTFTSDPILCGNGYFVIVDDVNNCAPVEVSGMPTCDCVSEAGNLDLTPITNCGLDTLTANYLGGAIFDPNDVLAFILYENTSNIFGSVLATNIVPEFSFLPSIMSYDSSYYIAAIVGTDDGTGLPNFADPCLDFSLGVEIIFLEMPSAILSGDTTSCQSNIDVTLQVDFTGMPPFDFTISDGTNAFDYTDISDNPFLITFSNVVAPTTYSIDNLTNGSCSGMADGTAFANVSDSPEIFNLNFTCTCDYTGVFANAEIMGGNPPYSVTSGNASIIGNALMTDTLPQGDPFFIIIEDASGCETILDLGSVLCNCETESGTMDLTPIKVCGEANATAIYDDQFQIFDCDDILQFFLHEGSGANLVNIIASNTSPEFDFQANMQFGTTYYISAVVGSDDGTGNVNLNDLCLDVSQGTPITFYEEPSATIFGNETICQFETAAFNVVFTGIPPFNFTISDGASLYNFDNISTFNYSVDFSGLTQSTTFILISVSDANCDGNVNGTVTLNLIDPPNISNIASTCDCASNIWIGTAELMGGATPFTITSNNATITNNQLTTVPVISGEGLEVTILDAEGCTYFISYGPVLCDCETAVGLMDLSPLIVCDETPANPFYEDLFQFLDCDDALQFFLHEGSGVTLNNIIATNEQPAFSFQSPMELGTTYYISAAVGNGDGQGNVDLNDPCLAVSQGTPVTFLEPMLEVSNDTTICDGETVQLVATAPNATEFVWSPTTGLSCTDCPSPFATPTSTTNYTVTAIDASGCPLEEEILIVVQCMTVYETLPHPSFNLQTLILPPWQLVAPIDMCDDIDDGHVAWGFHPNGQDIFYSSISPGVDTICFLLEHPASVFINTTLTIIVTVVPLNGNGGTSLIAPETPEWVPTEFSQNVAEKGNVNEDIFENEVNVFPNPAKDVFTIHSPNSLLEKCKLFTISGQMIKAFDLDGFQKNIDISAIESGTYFLEILTEKNRLIKKVIVFK